MPETGYAWVSEGEIATGPFEKWVRHWEESVHSDVTVSDPVALVVVDPSLPPQAQAAFVRSELTSRTETAIIGVWESAQGDRAAYRVVP
jgi:hypothetical protein